MFALFLGDYDGLLAWAFPKTIRLSVRDQLDHQNKWTITFAPSEKISFRRPTREPCPTLTNFNFFPQSKMFTKAETFLLNNNLKLEIKFINLPVPEGGRSFFHIQDCGSINCLQALTGLICQDLQLLKKDSNTPNSFFLQLPFG